MKKLLFVTALLAMGTMAMGENPTQNAESKAEVLVKAQIVDDLFKITDIDGNPLVLDFKELPKMNYTNNIAKASVEYKVTAKEAIVDSAVELAMSLTSFENPESKDGVSKVILKNEDSTAAQQDPIENDPNRIEANLGLDKATKKMEINQTTVVGKINGTINTDLSDKNTGDYSGKVFLVATVK
ncbi:hypothetical protein [Fusobacterium perfoetens]|uniref:hypothetical protein n=1 Tax=Fusobacterium perfoetens TaxID=852 RepID=UPI001F324EFE|nr:hypothetical protein [Fusobacterium perfoetens]MCF2612143.1 hypothetical protein [Fusobacterium perfoetens]